MFLEDISGIRCCCWSAPVPGCRAGMSRSRPWHSDLQDTSDSFHGEARCLRDTRRTADLHEICGPAPELSKDPGSCSTLLRSQPLCSATPRVLVWHRDHTRRSCKTVSRMPSFQLCQGLFVAPGLFSAKSIAQNSAARRRNSLRMPGIFRRRRGNLQLLRRLHPEATCCLFQGL